MDQLQPWAEALLLGILEGLTEFLPVSSTAHLLLVGEVIGFHGPPGKTFEIVIQLGAILAMLWIYRARLFGAVFALPSDPAARRFALAVILAFLPAAILGATFHRQIKEVLFVTPAVIGAALAVGGLAILAIERWRPAPVHEAADRLPWRTALLIGCAQCLALVPGVSRSGATIMGALMLKVDRKAAAEFSFFVAIPTMLGATVYDLYKNRDTLTWDGGGLIATGFVAAFVTAMLVVRPFVAFVAARGFTAFAIYRIALGLLVLLAALGGWLQGMPEPVAGPGFEAPPLP